MKEFRISVPAFLTVVVRAENEKDAITEAANWQGEEFHLRQPRSPGSYLGPVGTIASGKNFKAKIDDVIQVGDDE